jgi:hypothetical protein
LEVLIIDFECESLRKMEVGGATKKGHCGNFRDSVLSVGKIYSQQTEKGSVKVVVMATVPEYPRERLGRKTAGGKVRKLWEDSWIQE